MRGQHDGDIDGPDTALALARAALQIGRLDGAVSHISPEILGFYAVRSVRRALQASLAAAGHPVSLGALRGWIGRTHGPPASPDTGRVSADALACVVLARLQRGPWAPLAEGATLVARACPHLLRPLDREERVELDRVADEADILFEPPPLLAPMLPSLIAAQAHPDFVDGERATTTITAPQGPLVVETRGAIGHAWALGLAAPPALSAGGWSRVALPLFGSVPRRCLRPGLSPAMTNFYWANALNDAAEAALEDLEDAVRLTRTAQAALTTRRQSHARDVWALIAGLGSLRRSQVAAAFGMTLAGADQALARLTEVGLIQRPDPRGPYIVASTPSSPTPRRTVDAPPIGATAEVDAALAAIDRLLGITDQGA
jgi:hypothetical protein